MSEWITPEEFAAYWNDTESYPTIRSIAEEMGKPYDSVKAKGKNLKRAYDEGRSDVALVDRSGTPGGKTTVPEMRFEFQEDMSSEDCLELLVRVQGENPERHITLNFFRNYTEIADSTWTRYFGTFLEFRRQAGLEMSRGAHALQREIAKHRSVDHYREFNERHDYSDRYMKPVNKKIKTMICCSDLHDVEIDPFYLRVLVEACKIVQPDVVNFGGDIFDLAEFGKYGVDPREWDIVGKIKFAHENIFEPIREACPDAQLDFVEGNHEYRLLRHLAEATPALQAILSDLMGLSVSHLLGLDKYEINYIAKGDLAAYNKGDQKKEVSKSYVLYDDAYLIHHHPHASAWGYAGHNGHHHSYNVKTTKHATKGALKWSQLGCGHMTKASYCEGEFWDMGFMIVHINTETGSVTKEYISVTDLAVVGGIMFDRRASEMVGFYGDLAGRQAA